MEKDLSRRDFLKISAIGISSAYVGSFLNSIFIPEARLDIIKSKDYNIKISGIPGESFLPLESGIGFGTNFDIFKKIIEEIDPYVHFKIGVSLDYKNHIFSIPYNFSYKDIPDLIKIIKGAIKPELFENTLSSIKKNYEDMAFLVYKAGQKTKNSEFYNKSAIKLYSISCLYSGIKDEKTIIDGFEKLINGEREIGKSKKVIQKDIIRLDSRLKLKGMSLPLLKFNPEENKKLSGSKDQNEFYSIFLSNINKYCESLLIKDKNDIRSILVNILNTKVKVNEIIGTDKKTCIENITSDINNFISSLKSKNSANNEQEAYSEFEKRLNNIIKNSLKDDFEKGIYYTMTTDINKDLKYKSAQSVMQSMKVFDSKERNPKYFVKYLSLMDFVTKNFTKEETSDFNELLKKSKDPYPIDELIKTLPKEKQKDIKTWQQELIKTLESSRFKEITSDIKNGKFKTLRDKIMYLNDNEKSNILYLIFSVIGNGIYNDIINPKKYYNKFDKLAYSSENNSPLMKNVLSNDNEIAKNVLLGATIHQSNERKTRYESRNFQLKHLKEKNGSFNCMGISVLGNHIIEDMFGLKGEGLVVYKMHGKKTEHMVNGIKIGDNILWIDFTNNEYFTIKNEGFDKNYQYESLDFANAYMTGAMDSVSVKEMENIIKSKSKIQYIKGYLDKTEENDLSKANRNKAKYWSSIKPKAL